MTRKKTLIILSLITTLFLAAVALFTVLKLPQEQPFPAASPSPLASPQITLTSPQASAELPLQAPVGGGGICELTFIVSPSPSPSPSPSRSPSPSPSRSPNPSPSPSASFSPQCWESCTNDSQCPGSLVCQEISGVNRCVNSNCPTESDCVCPVSPSPSPQCWDSCTADTQCPGSLVCRTIDGSNRCVNESCPTESDCVCPVSPSPSPSVLVLSSPSAVSTQQLPPAGFISPTLIFSFGGLLLLILGLLF